MGSGEKFSCTVVVGIDDVNVNLDFDVVPLYISWSCLFLATKIDVPINNSVSKIPAINRFRRHYKYLYLFVIIDL